jgi:hypothetical protein
MTIVFRNINKKHMRSRRLIALALIAMLAVASAAVPAVASDQTDVMATVHQFVDGFNAGDSKKMLAACAPQSSVIDDFPPPYGWQGSGCAQWWSAYQATTKAEGSGGAVVTLGKPSHDDVTGGRAYVVVPVTYSFELKGKRISGAALYTISLQKFAAGWRITAWAWAAR